MVREKEEKELSFSEMEKSLHAQKERDLGVEDLRKQNISYLCKC